MDTHKYGYIDNEHPYVHNIHVEILDNIRIIFTQPLRLGRIWHKVIFKRSLTGLNSEFSF